MLDFLKAKRFFNNNPCQETYDNFAEAFHDVIIRGVKFHCPVRYDQSGKMHLWAFQHNGRILMPVFTSRSLVRVPQGVLISVSAIEKVIHDINRMPQVSGLIIDPGSEEYVILDKSQLEYVSGIYNPRLHPKDWGMGIPEYLNDDLLSDEEKLEFAIDSLIDAIPFEGYTIVDRNYALSAPSNIIAEKDGERRSITVRCFVSNPTNLHNVPKLTEPEKALALEFAAKINAKAYYAPFGIAAADMDRFNQGVALYGDQYLPQYSGMEPI